MARPNELGMPSKRTKKGPLGISRAQIRLSQHDNVAIAGQWFDISGYLDSKTGFWLTNWESEYGNVELDEKIYSQY